MQPVRGEADLFCHWFSRSLRKENAGPSPQLDGELRQEDLTFKASLGPRVNSRFSPCHLARHRIKAESAKRELGFRQSVRLVRAKLWAHFPLPHPKTMKKEGLWVCCSQSQPGVSEPHCLGGTQWGQGGAEVTPRSREAQMLEKSRGNVEHTSSG